MEVLPVKCRPQRSFTRVYANQVLDVKVFSGDCINDTPEFCEVHRIRAKVADVCKLLDSSTHMIKINIETHPVFRHLGLLAHEKAKEVGYGDCPCCMCVLRVSGSRWKFPFHFDSGSQLVLHLQGIKKWYWKENANALETKMYMASPGDIIHIPAGIWHATENVTESVIVNYGWRTSDSSYLKNCFSSQYPYRQYVLNTVGDNDSMG